jgi:hypothetical protein
MVTRTLVRDSDRTWRSSNVLEERPRKREVRIQGLKRWKVHSMVALLPLMILASLVLFCVALLIMLFDLYRPISYPTLVILAAGICFFSTTVTPALDANAPFNCPVTNALQTLSRWFYLQLSLIPPQLDWRSGGPMCMDTDDVPVNIHLAICNQLYVATSKVVENLPMFTALFECTHPICGLGPCQSGTKFFLSLSHTFRMYRLVKVFPSFTNNHVSCINTISLKLDLIGLDTYIHHELFILIYLPLNSPS